LNAFERVETPKNIQLALFFCGSVFEMFGSGDLVEIIPDLGQLEQ
jgi:hypothetical protein